MNRRSFFKTILAGLGMVAVPSVFVAAKPVPVSIINLDDKVTWMLHTGRLVTVDKEAPQTVTIHPPWQLFRATNKME